MRSVIVDRRKIAHQAAPSTTPEVLPATTLTDMEREALRHALSAEFLGGVDKSGRIKNDKITHYLQGRICYCIEEDTRRITAQTSIVMKSATRQKLPGTYATSFKAIYEMVAGGLCPAHWLLPKTPAMRETPAKVSWRAFHV